MEQNVDKIKLGMTMQTVSVAASFISTLVKQVSGNDISTTINGNSLNDQLIFNMVCNKINNKFNSPNTRP